MSFLDVNIILEQGKTTTSVYCKTSLGDIFTNFDSFLQSTYKICMIHSCYVNVSGYAQIGLSFTLN